MSRSAKAIIEATCKNYDGIFGPFVLDKENEDDFATALHPMPDNRYTEGNRITFSIESNIDDEYENRVAFIDDKTKPGPMGEPQDLDIKFGFDKEHGRINNYTFSERKGGYIYFAAYKEDVLFCAELHSQRRHIEDSDLELIMKSILDSFQ